MCPSKTSTARSESRVADKGLASDEHPRAAIWRDIAQFDVQMHGWAARAGLDLQPDRASQVN